MKNRIKNATKKGFSLVELLVVVAIIGVLAGVGIVAYNNYIDDADQKVVKANATLLAKKISAERATPTADFGTPRLTRQSAASDFVARAKTYAGSINITVSTEAGTTHQAVCAAANSVGIYVDAAGGVSTCYNDGSAQAIKAY